MQDLYVKKSTVLKSMFDWQWDMEDCRTFCEALEDIPGEEIKLSKPWNKVTDKLPVVSGSYMVTVLQDGVASTHEAVFKCGRFYDPVEEWQRYTGVIAWSGMPEPYKPEG